MADHNAILARQESISNRPQEIIDISQNRTGLNRTTNRSATRIQTEVDMIGHQILKDIIKDDEKDSEDKFELLKMLWKQRKDISS